MKSIYFNIQAKGGSGKSLLTYLLALKNQYNDDAYFVDLDSSVKSSTQQLKFIQGKTPPRFAIMNLLDQRNKIDRQMLFENLIHLSKKNYSSYYLDFGAPESDQLLHMLINDFTAEEFKQIEAELNVEFVLNIVVAGGSAYEACTTYMSKIVEITNNLFKINIYINESTFLNHPQLIKEVTNYIKIQKTDKLSLQKFGDFDTTTLPHKNILSYIEHGMGMEAFVFVEKIKITKELAKI